MNQSHQQQHQSHDEQHHGQPIQHLLGQEQQRHHHHQSLPEYEDLKYFDWGSGIASDDEGSSFAVGGDVGVGGGHGFGAAASDVIYSSHPPQSGVPSRPGHDPSNIVDPLSMSMEPLPFFGGHLNDAVVWTASGRRFLDGVARAWGGIGAPSPMPPPPPLTDKMLPSISSEDDPLPGMVRSTSGSLSSESETSSSDGDDASMDGSDDFSSSSSSAPSPPLLPKGVTFCEQVRVLPIPPISAYTRDQVRRMYAGRSELRENKARNKKEYEFDGYDWRNATEEGSMAICPMSGELLHPAHL